MKVLRIGTTMKQQSERKRLNLWETNKDLANLTLTGYTEYKKSREKQ